VSRCPRRARHVIVSACSGRFGGPNEFAGLGKPLALDACRVAVFFGVFLHKITLPPFVPYIHFLVDYHFGFTKRASIGAVVALFTSKVPVWLVFALSGAVWLITAGLFVRLFRRTFGFDEKRLPLFVFMAGSPFFLKNFMHTLGHFDIYGCLFAICLLLIPARSLFYVLLAALFSMILILIHHIHLLMYVPTIAAIVMLRCYLVQGVRRSGVITGIAALAATGLLFIAAQFYGTMAVPEAEFVHYLQGRMADPSRSNLLSFAYIWHQPLSKEVLDTWARLPSNLLGVPVFALLIWLHAPLWRISSRSQHFIDTHRRIVMTAITIVSLAYLACSRWCSTIPDGFRTVVWCSILHAVVHCRHRAT
jgi:hypothetical protein